jgi:hypothetical protein
MYNGLSAKNGLLSAGFVVIAVSFAVSGAVFATSVLSVLEQPAKVIASAALSASDNWDFIGLLP